MYALIYSAYHIKSLHFEKILYNEISVIHVYPDFYIYILFIQFSFCEWQY